MQQFLSDAYGASSHVHHHFVLKKIIIINVTIVLDGEDVQFPEEMH